MKMTPLEIKGHSLRKSVRGYDVREVEALKELAAGALEDANREITRLEEKLRETEIRLSEHIQNENILRDAITTAQRMVDDIKQNARKEAELVIAEARLQAEEIMRQAQGRAKELKEEILRLRGQRAEMEASLKAVLDYHSTRLLIEEDESKRADEETEKLKFLK